MTTSVSVNEIREREGKKEISVERIEEAFKEAVHIEDLLDLYLGDESLLKFWKDAERPLELINQARAVLQLPDLDFKDP